MDVKAWAEKIRELYADIDGWIGNSSNVKITYPKETITEKRIGHYEVPEMIIHLPNKTINIIPKGINIVGAFGRVDLELIDKTSKPKSVTFVLVPKNVTSVTIHASTEKENAPINIQEPELSKLVWKVVKRRPRSCDLSDLNKAFILGITK